MSNGLLVGLTEAWMPDASKAMIGQKTGLNTGTDAGLSYVAQAGFPGGHALQSASTGAFVTTADSPLVEEIGITDFLFIHWWFVSDPGTVSPGVIIGEDSTNGLDVSADVSNNAGDPQEPYGEIPGADGGYSQTLYLGSIPALAVPHMQAFWYTTADSTFHLSIDGGVPVTLVNTAGVGNPGDPAGVYFSWSSVVAAAGTAQMGLASLWQGTAGVANAVSKLASLYASKLKFSDFDTGGSSPVLRPSRLSIGGGMRLS